MRRGRLDRADGLVEERQRGDLGAVHRDRPLGVVALEGPRLALGDRAQRPQALLEPVESPGVFRRPGPVVRAERGVLPDDVVKAPAEVAHGVSQRGNHVATGTHTRRTTTTTTLMMRPG